MKLEKIKARGCDGLYRHPKTGIIYFRKYRKEWGGEKTKSTHTKVIEEAKAFVYELLSKESAKRPGFHKNATVLELYDQWVERKIAVNKSQSTITSMKYARTYFEPYFRLMLPDEISAEWWETVYIPEVRIRAENAKRRFFNDRKWLNSFLRQLFEDGAIHKLPKIVNPDPKTKVGKVFTDEEIDLLLNFSQNDDLHLAILMAATMGMRRSEIFLLSWERVNLDKKTIHLGIADTKMRKERTFSISPVVYQFLVKRAQSGSPWVFPSKEHPDRHLHKDGFKTAWTNLKSTCGVRGRFHDLRHTFLTKAFKSPGANAALICAYAGLSLEVAEKVYLHLTEEDTRHVANVVTYGS